MTSVANDKSTKVNDKYHDTSESKSVISDHCVISNETSESTRREEDETKPSEVDISSAAAIQSELNEDELEHLKKMAKLAEIMDGELMAASNPARNLDPHGEVRADFANSATSEQSQKRSEPSELNLPEISLEENSTLKNKQVRTSSVLESIFPLKRDIRENPVSRFGKILDPTSFGRKNYFKTNLFHAELPSITATTTGGDLKENVRPQKLHKSKASDHKPEDLPTSTDAVFMPSVKHSVEKFSGDVGQKIRSSIFAQPLASKTASAPGNDTGTYVKNETLKVSFLSSASRSKQVTNATMKNVQASKETPRFFEVPYGELPSLVIKTALPDKNDSDLLSKSECSSEGSQKDDQSDEATKERLTHEIKKTVQPDRFQSNAYIKEYSSKESKTISTEPKGIKSIENQLTDEELENIRRVQEMAEAESALRFDKLPTPSTHYFHTQLLNKLVPKESLPSKLMPSGEIINDMVKSKSQLTTAIPPTVLAEHALKAVKQSNETSKNVQPLISNSSKSLPSQLTKLKSHVQGELTEEELNHIRRVTEMAENDLMSFQNQNSAGPAKLSKDRMPDKEFNEKNLETFQRKEIFGKGFEKIGSTISNATGNLTSYLVRGGDGRDNDFKTSQLNDLKTRVSLTDYGLTAEELEHINKVNEMAQAELYSHYSATSSNFNYNKQDVERLVDAASKGTSGLSQQNNLDLDYERSRAENILDSQILRSESSLLYDDLEDAPEHANKHMSDAESDYSIKSVKELSKEPDVSKWYEEQLTSLRNSMCEDDDEEITYNGMPVLSPTLRFSLSNQ